MIILLQQIKRFLINIINSFLEKKANHRIQAVIMKKMMRRNKKITLNLNIKILKNRIINQAENQKLK